jgi:hypothetical protein
MIGLFVGANVGVLIDRGDVSMSKPLPATGALPAKPDNVTSIDRHDGVSANVKEVR